MHEDVAGAALVRAQARAALERAPAVVAGRCAAAPRARPRGPGAALVARALCRAGREVWLEIGFGGAEHLLWQARHNPEVGLIGCEVFEDGVVKALTGVAEHALANVRLSTDDARDLLRWLPPASLGRVFVLFPDPWPKKRHVKRRLVTRAVLDLLARVMTPRAELRIATDIGDYARTILLAARRHPALAWQAEGPRDWRERPADWPQTRYEAKASGRAAAAISSASSSRWGPKIATICLPGAVTIP